MEAPHTSQSKDPQPWGREKPVKTILRLPCLIAGVSKPEAPLVLCSFPHLSTASWRIPPGKVTSPSPTHTKPSQRDNFKSGKLCFYQPYRVPGKIPPSSLFGTRNCCLPPPGSHSLQTADFLSLLSAPGSTGRVKQSSKQMRYYLLVPVPAAHNSGWTDCSNYNAFFIHSNESIASLVSKK